MEQVIIAGAATVIGSLLGVAVKCTVDFSRDKNTAEKLWKEFQVDLEADLLALKENEDWAASWDSDISALCFHEYWKRLDATHQSEGVKRRIVDRLGMFFNEHALVQRVAI